MCNRRKNGYLSRRLSTASVAAADLLEQLACAVGELAGGLAGHALRRAPCFAAVPALELDAGELEQRGRRGVERIGPGEQRARRPEATGRHLDAGRRDDRRRIAS